MELAIGLAKRSAERKIIARREMEEMTEEEEIEGISPEIDSTTENEPSPETQNNEQEDQETQPQQPTQQVTNESEEALRRKYNRDKG